MLILSENEVEIITKKNLSNIPTSMNYKQVTNISYGIKLEGTSLFLHDVELSH